MRGREILETETKTCKKCGEVFPISCFIKVGKYIRGDCKFCRSKYYKKKFLENEAHYREVDAQYRKNNSDKHAVACRNWRLSNSDLQRIYRQSNREKRNMQHCQWMAKHPGLGSKYRMLRRARLRAVFCEKIDRLSIFERDKGICHICGKNVDPNYWDLDHVIPLSKGGAHTQFNVAVSHPFCNRSKGDRIIENSLARSQITSEMLAMG